MKVLIINEKDNVAVAVDDIKKGDQLKAGSEEIISKNDIKTGHKIALRKIIKDNNIIKYGIIIGIASADIEKGEWVHTHNVEDITEQLCDEYAKEYRSKAGMN